jgi:hypothetical protein
MFTRSDALAARLVCSWLVVIALIVAGPVQGNAQSGGPVEAARSGEQLYRAACAQCHGADGKGRSSAVLGFSVPLPDFTDCNFATREPNADWFAITWAGGPARAFHEMMPAFGAALSAGEIESSLNHIRGFCARRSWPRGELNLPRPLVTEKAYPEDEAVFSTGTTLEGEGAVFNEIVYERRFGSGTQVELIVPFGWRERQTELPDGRFRSDWTGGLDDVAIGIKQVMVHSLRRGYILSGGADVIFPTGDEDDGFGAGTTRFETFLAGGLLLPREVFVHTQAGLELPANPDVATEEGFARLVLGKSFTEGRFGRTWSPMVEVLWLRELTSGAPSEWDVLPQMQVTLSKRQHIMANLGVRIPLTQTGVRQTELLFYVLWDWFDGGLLEGWR